MKRSECIGRRWDELLSPALLLDLAILRRNILTMAERARSHAAVRPHAKVHKSPEIARLQIAAGAVGVTVATVWEMLALVEAGVTDVLIANEIVEPEKLALVAGAARCARIAVGVDDPAGAQALAAAAATEHVELEVMLDVDIGMQRGGVRSIPEALALAESIRRLPNVRLRGVMAWEGHVAHVTDWWQRAELAAQAIAKLLACVDALEDAGQRIEVVSAGGTNTYDMTGANPRITEIQAGTYALMDTSYGPLSPAFEPALSVLGTVVSRHPGRAILDCGSKVQAVTELAPPQVRGGRATVHRLNEEHALLDVAGGDEPRLGERVQLIVSHAPNTVNLHDVYHVIEGGVVVDIWPIVGRGPGRGPIR